MMDTKKNYGINRACRVLSLSTSVCYYQAKPKDLSHIEQALLQMAQEHPAEGFWKAHRRLKAQGAEWNHKVAIRAMWN